MELNQLSKIAPLCGNCLNVEEMSGLQVALQQVKVEENIRQKMYFWGKITGTKQDYLVVFYFHIGQDFPIKKYYYCTTSDYNLRQIPTNSIEYNVRSMKITSLFLGDPSFFTYGGDEPEIPPSDDPEAPPPERFRELNRLSYVVNVIYFSSVLPLIKNNIDHRS